MQPTSPPFQMTHLRAALGVLLVAFLWGVSAPVSKAFLTEQQTHAGLLALTMTQVAAVLAFGRGIAAAGLVAALQPKALRNLSKLEIEQSLLLGVLNAITVFIGADATHRMDASVLGFLLQFSCIFVPLLVAIGQRRIPSLRIIACVLLVLIGGGVLVQLDWRNLHLGFGELQAIFCGFVFAIEILIINARRYENNRPAAITILLWFVVALLLFASLPLMGIPLSAISLLWHSTFSTACWIIPAFLSFGLAQWIVIHYQRHLPPSEVGIIYAIEGVFTALACLFIPGLLSAWGGFHYPNEHLTWHLVIGGLLITAANVWLQWPERSLTPKVPSPPI